MNDKRTESMMIPKYSRTLDGVVTDFSQFIRKPRDCNKRKTVSKSSRAPSSG